MAEISDCNGKRIKISKNSITIKNDSGKTCGVVKNATGILNLQSNKQFDFSSKIRKLGLWGKLNRENYVIKDDTLYYFRNMKSIEWNQKYGYFSDYEKEKAMQEENAINILRNANIQVIECYIL